MLLLAGILFLNCERQKTRQEIDRDIILNYISDNNLDAIEHESGLFYVIEDPGSGEDFPSFRSRVEVRYKGYFTDGVVFDESPGNNTVEFNLTQTVTGWQIGVPLLKKGGRGTLIIPSGLGYGFFGSGPVPPSTVIIFDIELVNFSF
jgi:FKBP-type peptidyl-prolyl cis-trans isomerase